MRFIERALILWVIFLILSFIPTRGFAYNWEFWGWYGGGAYPDVGFDPQVRDRLYLSSDVAGIWRSDNAGATWKPMSKGLKNLNVAFIEIGRAHV